MFKWKVEEDKYESEQIRYYLTQGDTCGLKFRPINPETGEAVSHALISRILFKLYKNDSSRECIYHKEFSYLDNEYWLFKMLSEENTFAVGRYKYEIEVTMLDGDVNTPNQWYFEIIEQAVCEA